MHAQTHSEIHTELWNTPADLWPAVSEAVYRRQRVAQDVARARGWTGAGRRPSRWTWRRRPAPAGHVVARPARQSS
jgi:hypothetical protein